MRTVYDGNMLDTELTKRINDAIALNYPTTVEKKHHRPDLSRPLLPGPQVEKENRAADYQIHLSRDLAPSSRSGFHIRRSRRNVHFLSVCRTGERAALLTQ